MASECWRPLRRRSWGRRWSQEPGRSNRWCCRMPTATWRRWRASREGVGCTRRRQLSSPSLSSSASERKQPNSSFSSNTTSSMAYGGPFNQLGSSSIRLVIRSSPSTLSALRDLARSELHGDHDAGADVGAAERSGMRPERLADREITELHSGDPPLSDRNAVTRRSHPTGRVQRASSLFPWRLPSAARSRHEGGRGGGTIASGPAAPSTIGMMMAEVHGQSSPHRTPWLRSLIAADTCADVRVFVGRRLLPAGPPAEERMGGRRGA